MNFGYTCITPVEPREAKTVRTINSYTNKLPIPIIHDEWLIPQMQEAEEVEARPRKRPRKRERPRKRKRPRERERPQEEEPQEGEVCHRNKKYTLSLMYILCIPKTCCMWHSAFYSE